MLSSAFSIPSSYAKIYAPLLQKGEFEALKRACQSHLARVSSNATKDVPAIVQATRDLASAHYDLGEFAKAAERQCDAIRLDIANCKAKRQEHAFEFIRLSYFYVKARKVAEAELAYESGISVADKFGTTGKLKQSTILDCLARIQVERGDLFHAMRSWAAAGRLRIQEFNFGDANRLTPYYQLTKVLWRMGNVRAAIRCAARTKSFYEMTSDFDTISFAEFLGVYANILAVNGDGALAASLFERSLGVLRRCRPVNHPDRIEVEMWAKQLPRLKEDVTRAN